MLLPMVVVLHKCVVALMFFIVFNTRRVTVPCFPVFLCRLPACLPTYSTSRRDYCHLYLGSSLPDYCYFYFLNYLCNAGVRWMLKIFFFGRPSGCLTRLIRLIESCEMNFENIAGWNQVPETPDWKRWDASRVTAIVGAFALRVRLSLKFQALQASNVMEYSINLEFTSNFV